jgi:hypothetical protein
MGLLSADHQPNGWDPDQVRKPARVAMIDTSVAMDHPNLCEAVNDKLAFDLFSTRLGAFPGRVGAEEIGALPLGNSDALVAGLPGCKDLLHDLKARLAPDQTPQQGTVQPATSPVFSGHGTAIAGLIGARPALVPFSKAHMDGPANGMLPLPYCGVDPTCEIVPISTNFDTDPEQMILAFLYADLIEADVIVLPRGIDDPFRTEPELYAQEFHGSLLGELVAPCPIPDAQRALWAELAELIIKVSLRRPVVCAAGNANEEYGIYPANLASDDNGVIAVGAVNALGWPCSYSPSSELTIWAPSTDAERFDSAETRLDDSVPRDNDFGIPENNHNDKFYHVSIISTDVPGAGGYSASPIDHAAPEDGVPEYGSYFCAFGGTSAASAIIAGFLALGRGLNQLPAGSDGVAAKAWLLAQAKAPHVGCPSVMVPQFGESTFRPVTS